MKIFSILLIFFLVFGLLNVVSIQKAYSQDADIPQALDMLPIGEETETPDESVQQEATSTQKRTSAEQEAFINGGMAGLLGGFVVGFTCCWLFKDALLKPSRAKSVGV